MVGVGLPQPLAISVDAQPISAGITAIPKLSIGLDPLTLEPVTVNPLTLTLTPLTIEPLSIEVKPLDISLSLKEIPSVRVHLPVNFSLGLSLLGHKLFSARLCGEAQVITEPYEPNPCEHCGPRDAEGQ